MSSEKVSILIVEDDPEQLRAFASALRGYRLTCVSSGTNALASLNSHLPDLIILDHILADGERGVDFLPQFKEVAAHIPIIVISGKLKIERRLQALQGPQAPHYTLKKPVGLAELNSTVEEALRSGEPDRCFTDRPTIQRDLSDIAARQAQPE